MSLMLFLFSLTLIIGSILSFQQKTIIVILCSINIFMSLYYIWNVSKLQEIFKLETKLIIRFAKHIGLITLIYIPHVLIFVTMFFGILNNLEILLISLIILLEIILIIIVFKEVYDLIFTEESKRDFEIEKNRKKYIETEKKPTLGE
ncbi:MAG: hypothetical protein ACFFDF_11790 [Candidatus Odinarchaeota archaeon]